MPGLPGRVQPPPLGLCGVTAVVLRGDAAHLPLPDASVDLICCSPPYFGLRSYADTVKCYDCIQMEYAGRDPRQAWPDYDAHVREIHQRHYDGQVGSEATPREYLAALAGCTREWVRVLKPSGSIFVNLGDKYAAGHGGRSTMRPEDGGRSYIPQSRTWKDAKGDGSGRRYGEGHQGTTPHVVIPGTMPKSLLGLPWRYALACMDDLGLILRRDIIWHKPNGLPESVTDRCRSSHEYVFHLVRSPRYFAAVDEIREPHAPASVSRFRYGDPDWSRSFVSPDVDRAAAGKHRMANVAGNPLGKLPGSVWSIPSAPLSVPGWLGVDHFAAYPPELCRRIILGWSPPGICTACGEGRRPVSGRDLTVNRKGRQSQRESCTTINGRRCYNWRVTDAGRAEAEKIRARDRGT